jgi:ABC-type phosphate transport system permease subunit
VSVITPAYNAAAFLPAAVGSVIAQTYGDWEMLVVAPSLARYFALARSAALAHRAVAGDHASRLSGVRANRAILAILRVPYLVRVIEKDVHNDPYHVSECRADISLGVHQMHCSEASP